MNKIQLIILRAKVKLGKTKGNSVKDVTFQQLMTVRHSSTWHFSIICNYHVINTKGVKPKMPLGIASWHSISMWSSKADAFTDKAYKCCLKVGILDLISIQYSMTQPFHSLHSINKSIKKVNKSRTCRVNFVKTMFILENTPIRAEDQIGNPNNQLGG